VEYILEWCLKENHYQFGRLFIKAALEVKGIKVGISPLFAYSHIPTALEHIVLILFKPIQQIQTKKPQI
jgi:hypothetical protein